MLWDVFVIIIYSFALFAMILWFKGYRFRQNKDTSLDNLPDDYDGINISVDEIIKFMKNTIGIKPNLEKIIEKKLQSKYQKEKNK